MNSSKGVFRLALAGAVLLALALAPVSANACENNWGLVGTPGDAQVSLAWNALPANSTAKIVRTTHWWVQDGTTGDTDDGSGDATEAASDAHVSRCDFDHNNLPVVVYVGADQSFVDTGVVNGQTYYYTLFVKDTTTGEYVDGVSEINVTPNAAPDTLTTPSLSTGYVKKAVGFSASSKVSTKHTTVTHAQLVLYKKVGGKWTYTKSATKTMAAGVQVFKGSIAAPSSGSYKLVVKHIGVGEATVASPARFFYSH